jgi:palmitoyltransferase
MVRPYERQDHLATELELSSGNEKEEFRRRQDADFLRRRQPFHRRYDEQSVRSNRTDGPSLYVGGTDEHGEESWKNTEGEGLADFGADEEAEFYDEDVPLAELLERRKLTNA